MKILLQHKIFIGYFLLMAIIGSMVAIVLHERSRVQKIENESIAIFQTQHNINSHLQCIHKPFFPIFKKYSF